MGEGGSEVAAQAVSVVVQKVGVAVVAAMAAVGQARAEEGKALAVGGSLLPEHAGRRLQQAQNGHPGKAMPIKNGIACACPRLTDSR